MTWINDKALDDIRRVGWHIMGIEGDDTTPNVVHTIGLHQTYRHPEIVMVGLKTDAMMQVVSDLGQRVADGTKLSCADELDDVLEGYKVRFEDVLVVAHERFLPGAAEFYGRESFEAIQCLWPDKDGVFPTNRDFDPDCASVEPRLGDPEWTPIYATWEFENSYVLACFATRFVVDGTQAITLVTHDDDGAWQFLCGTTNKTKDAKVIALQSAVKIDPSVTELADLPRGWRAFREEPGAEWVREPLSAVDEDE